MTQDDRREDEGKWEVVAWDRHHAAQRRRMAQLSLIEKIRWLEEAQQLAEQLRKKPD